MNDKNHADSTDNPEKKPSKMRHTEDEQRIIHENTADESRLEHRESYEEDVLKHDNKDSADANTSQYGDSTSRDNMLPAIRRQEESPIPSGITEGENPSGENINNPVSNQTDADPQNDSNNYGIDEGKLAGILTTVGKIFPDDDNITSQAIKETPAAVLSAISDVKNMRERGQRLFFENKDKKEEPISSGNEPKSEEAVDSENLTDDTALIENKNVVSDDKNNESASNIETVEKRGYYEVLGVREDADESEIKNAYRTLAKKFHPDVNSGDKNSETKFNEINEAYSVLGDPQKRQAYDQEISVKTGGNKSVKKSTAENKIDIETTETKDFSNGKYDKPLEVNKNGGKKKDRMLRRTLDSSYIFSQAATHLMPDETQEEDSGTKGIRKMITESAKIIKIFATAEKPKDSKLKHAEDEETLIHEDNSEEIDIEYEGVEGETILQIEDSNNKLSNHGEVPELKSGMGQLTSGNILPQQKKRSGSEAISENAETENTSAIPGNSTDSGDTLDTEIPDIIPQSKSDIKTENKIDKNIDRLTSESAKLEKKIGKAEKKIPKNKVKKSKLMHDPKTG